MSATALLLSPPTGQQAGADNAFVVVPARAVFDVHDEHAPDGKLLRRFGVSELNHIASRCNARDARGAWCPLTLGHTRPGRPESEQPASVGYARNFRVGPDPATGSPALLADFWFRRERYNEALPYMRVSVELWPNDWVLDPVALLARTPRLDIPQWHYGRSAYYPSRQGDVIRYSRESPMPDAAPGGMAPPSPTNAMPAPAPAAPPAPGGGMPEKLEQFARHCMSHEYAREIMDHYGGAGGAGAGPAEAPLGAEPPPGGAPPGGPAMFSRDAEVQQLRRELAALQRENRHAARRQDLQARAERGIQLDVDEELGLLGDLEPTQYARELARIDNRYARTEQVDIDVLGGEGDGEVHDHALPYSRKPGAGNRYVRDGALTMEGAKEAVRYQRENPELTYEQARETVLKQHAKNGRA